MGKFNTHSREIQNYVGPSTRRFQQSGNRLNQGWQHSGFPAPESSARIKSVQQCTLPNHDRTFLLHLSSEFDPRDQEKIWS